MKKILYSLAALALVFSSCTEENEYITAGQSHPQIIISCNGEFVHDNETLAIPIDQLPLTISSTVVNADGATHQWSVDGDPVDGALASRYTFDSEWSGPHPVTLTVTDSQNKKTTLDFTIDVEGPYKGMLLMVIESDNGMTSGEVDVVDEGGTVTKGVFAKANGNASMSASLNDATIYGNSLYTLKGAADNYLYEMDLQTMKLRRVISRGSLVLPAGMGVVCRRVVVASAEKAYVTMTNEYNAAHGGIVSVDLTQGEATAATLEAGMFADKPVVLNGKVYYGAGNSLKAIDTADDAIATIKTFDEGRIVKGLALAKDGNLYVSLTAVAGNAETKPRMVCFDAASLAEQWAEDMDIADPASNLCPSPSEDVIFFAAAGSGWGAKAKIYKYDIPSRSATLFVDPNAALYNYMNLSADGSELYFGHSNGYSSGGFYVYKTSDALRTSYPINMSPCIAFKL